MAAQKISQVSTILMASGMVYARVGAAHRNTVFEVVAGSAAVPMAPTQTNPVERLVVRNEFVLPTDNVPEDFTSMPAESRKGEYFAAWLNHLTDWTLSGTSTLQLMFPNRDISCHLTYGEPIKVSNATSDMRFEAWIAQHRAMGSLHVKMVDDATQEVTRTKVAFEPAFAGGTARKGYQHVSLPLPANMKTGTVSIEISYEGYRSDQSEVEPFMFVAGARVGAPFAAFRQAIQPKVFRQGETADDDIWMQAPLPLALADGDSVSLRAGGDTEFLMSVHYPKITLEDDYGHSFSLRSDRSANLLLCIDGQPTETLIFGTEHNLVRVPSRLLDGMTHHVSLRDTSGSITYWQTQAVLPAILTPVDVLQRETVAPFPSTIMAQTARRYESLKASIAAADKNTDLAQLGYAMSVLEGGYDNVKLKPLAFNRPKSPDVSIVIPAHNKVEVTYLGLCSLLVAHNVASFEVIVVDDASSDETAELETFVSGITVLHNEEPQRFIRACNRGAEAAKGKYIVLLNNDVEVTSGWLDELIDGFERFDNVGLAGSKLLYPTGELQDAGGIIWGSGNPWNYGNRQNPDDPRFSYARQADYLSGAAMMVPADVWREVGGLSSYMEPMYFEDTDFAFKVREAGYSTWFIPSSVVYHYEGMTSGTDVTSGYKKYQEVNRPKFKRRWAKAYAGFGKEGQKPDLEKDRGIQGRVLFIDYSTPRPDQDAGSYAALKEMQLVQSLGYKVTFLPSNMAHLGSYTTELQKMGIEVIFAPFFLSQSEYLVQHAAEFDAFFITRYYVANDVLDQLRSLAPDTRILFNNADLHFLREIRAARAEGDDALIEKARKTQLEEMRIINEVDVVLSYNEVEHSVIEAYSEGKATVVKCPWVVDIPDEKIGIEGRKGMSFLGSYRHHPNAEGINWFVRDILPAVIAEAGPQHLTIYGSGMTDEIKALASDDIDPVGFVADLADAYDRHRIFIAPLRSGAGIKGKVLSALAHGVPCVLSPTAAEGIGLRSGHDCFIAHTPQEWAEAIAKLSTDDDLWTMIAENAQTYMRDAFSFERGRNQMRKAFEAADLFGSVD